MTTIQSRPAAATAAGRLSGKRTRKPRPEVPVRLGFRRAVQVGLPAATGALLVFAVLSDPGGAVEGRAMVEAYAADVDQLQWHAASLHWAYGLWGLVPIALAPLVRGRGRRLMNVAAALGAVMMMSMPGLMLSDLFFAAIANEHGIDAAMKMYDGLPAEQWAIKSYMTPGIPSMFLCLPVAFAALARAGLAPWWGVAVAIAVLPLFAISMGALWLTAVVGLLFVVLSVLVARATRAPQRRGSH